MVQVSSASVVKSGGDGAQDLPDITRLEVHAPAAEIARLREPMANLNPKWFEVEAGFRR